MLEIACPPTALLPIKVQEGKRKVIGPGEGEQRRGRRYSFLLLLLLLSSYERRTEFYSLNFQPHCRSLHCVTIHLAPASS